MKRRPDIEINSFTLDKHIPCIMTFSLQEVTDYFTVKGKLMGTFIINHPKIQISITPSTAEGYSITQLTIIHSAPKIRKCPFLLKFLFDLAYNLSTGMAAQGVALSPPSSMVRTSILSLDSCLCWVSHILPMCPWVSSMFSSFLSLSIVNGYVKTCAWCPVMDYHTIWCAFSHFVASVSMNACGYTVTQTWSGWSGYWW